MTKNNRYSFSRIDQYNKCPRKHYYQYVERIQTAGNEALIAGNLFHSGVEKLYKGEDLKDILDRYKALVNSTTIKRDIDMLENVLTRYYAYYGDTENILDIEWKFTDILSEEEGATEENSDVYSGVIDKIIELDDGTVKIRDTKTTFSELKYTPDDVRTHQQLLSYVPFVEEKFNVKVSCIEIDEVRLANLMPVPINANGKPSADKRKLGLVLYEDYYNKLAEMELEDAPEYQGILDYLEKRGHCLFRRTAVQILDDNIISSNLSDLYEAYTACKTGNKNRVRGPLCKWCAFYPLCNLDYYNPNEDDRSIVIDKIMSIGAENENK